MPLGQRWNLPYVVTTTDLMFRKNLELQWFDKLHVEIGLCGSGGCCDDFYL